MLLWDVSPGQGPPGATRRDLDAVLARVFRPRQVPAPERARALRDLGSRRLGVVRNQPPPA